MQTCIIIFIKAPTPGQVKTRLAKSIGDEKAAQLYRCFTEDILETVDALGVSSLIFFTPAQDEELLKSWIGSHRRYQAQQGSHLGERMAHAFCQSFELGYKQVLILGSDSPDLPPAYLVAAIEALQQEQVVIGPSLDGGYYTLGFTPHTFCPEVFGPLPWSTPQVYPQTLEILRLSSCSLKVLPVWSDIDTVDDLYKFYLRHQAMSASSRSVDFIRHTNVFKN